MDIESVFFFCGGGGSSLGLRGLSRKIKHIAGIEIDSEVAGLYEQNVGKVLNRDIFEIQPENISYTPDSICIYQISSPCQDYSPANRKNKKNVSTIDLTSNRANAIAGVYPHILYRRPEYIWLENVPAYANSKAYESYKKFLETLGYTVKFAVLDAYNFGVPQSRKRFFSLASKSGWGRDYKIRECDIHETWLDKIKPRIKELTPTRLTSVQLEAIARGGYDLNRSTLLVERAGYRTLPKVRNQFEPWKTLTATMGYSRPGHSRNQIIDLLYLGQAYTLDIKAIASLQGFPDDYQWSGKNYLDCKVVGNSVPPPVSKAIFEAIIGSFDQ